MSSLTAGSTSAARQRSSPDVYVAVALVLVATTSLHMANFWLHLRSPALDADGSAGIVGWASAACLAVAAAAALVCARDGHRRTALLAASLLVVVAVDRRLHVHSHIPHWYVVYLPLLAALGWAVL